jgi:hypothetical protein
MTRQQLFRFRGDIVQIRSISTAGVEVDLLLTRAAVLRLAAAVEDEPAIETDRIPPWRDL